MDKAKRAIILDGATEFYTLIQDVMALRKDDARTARLNRATEAFLSEVLALTREGSGQSAPAR
jgi:hypothetical protein